jgi:flagellar biosynthetic protein FliQ
MDAVQVLEWGRDLLWTALLLSGPALAASLLVGLVVSLLQAMTALQDQTLSLVPKLLVVALVLIWTMPWAMQLAGHFTERMLAQLAQVVR